MSILILNICDIFNFYLQKFNLFYYNIRMKEKKSQIDDNVVENNKKVKVDPKKTKLIVFISLIAVAILAVIAGVVVFYLASPDIKEVPQNLRVEQVDGDYYLTADYQDDFGYYFVIEQNINGEYIEIDVVESEINTINLSKNANILLNAGSEFRFMVAFQNENKSLGSFSNFAFWTVTGSLDKPVVSFENNILSWSSILNAYNYTLKITYPDTATKDIEVFDTVFDMNQFEKGIYQIYVVANPNGNFYSSTSNLITVQVI